MGEMKSNQWEYRISPRKTPIMSLIFFLFIFRLYSDEKKEKLRLSDDV